MRLPLNIVSARNPLARHLRVICPRCEGSLLRKGCIWISASLISSAGNNRTLASIYTRKHATLEALKKSLLHKAFNGEL